MPFGYAPPSGTTASFYVPAGAMQIANGSPSLGNLNRHPCWLMDPTATENVGTSLQLPTDWVNMAVDFEWSVTSGGSGTGVFWRFDYDETGDGLAITSPATTHVGTGLAYTAPASGTLKKSTVETSLAVNPAKRLVFNAVRSGAGTGDDFSLDATLHAVILRKV